MSNKLIDIHISVAHGEERRLTLPDGTEVWLNAGTTLCYPATFENTHQVQLNGEGFVVVGKDEKHPFIVQAKHLSVHVLGTTFNLKTYPEDSRTVTTLESGRVEIQTQTGQLHPCCLANK